MQQKTDKKFAPGLSDFAEMLRDKEVYFVDKSLLIKDILKEKDKVILISRPRRFGKTLNMSMISEFFGNPKSKNLFDNLLVSEHPEIMAHQGKYPVIFLSLKDSKQTNYLDALSHIREVMSALYGKFMFLKEVISSHHQQTFDNILYKRSEPTELIQSLKNLTQWLCEHFNQQVWVILDEYDAPIHSAWQYDYYKDMVSFMQGYLGAAFKDNSYLFRGVMSGILRVSRENIFSGLNNVRVYSMLSPKYGQYFGFTQAEVDQVCEDFDLLAERENIKRWYNGYKIGEVEIYNPWSLINFVTEKVFKPYWVNTSNNAVIQILIARSSAKNKTQFEQLMRGETISVSIDEHALLPNINGTDSDALWSFLLFSGYLKACSCKLGLGTDFLVEVGVPNEEIGRLYISQLSKFFNASNFSPESYLGMLNALTEGDADLFSKDLQHYLETSMSYFDAGREEPERFYHGFVLGILVALQETHEVKSNRESGRGRYDIMIFPKDRTKLGIIMEFKMAESASDLHLEKALAEAFEQIQSKNYASELKSAGIAKILTIAAVFYKKNCRIKFLGGA
jgi:hypothetical protein